MGIEKATLMEGATRRLGCDCSLEYKIKGCAKR